MKYVRYVELKRLRERNRETNTVTRGSDRLPMCVFVCKGIFQCFGFNYLDPNKDERKDFGRDKEIGRAHV